MIFAPVLIVYLMILPALSDDLWVMILAPVLLMINTLFDVCLWLQWFMMIYNVS